MNDKGNRFINALAYIGILFFLPLLLNPKSKISKFHANQGLVLLLLAVAGSIFFGFLFGLGSFLYGIYSFGLFVLMVIGIINAWNGLLKPLPLIGGIHILHE